MHLTTGKSNPVQKYKLYLIVYILCARVCKSRLRGPAEVFLCRGFYYGAQFRGEAAGVGSTLDCGSIAAITLHRPLRVWNREQTVTLYQTQHTQVEWMLGYKGLKEIFFCLFLFISTLVLKDNFYIRIWYNLLLSSNYEENLLEAS